MLAADETINFVGNVEARELLNGVADVVVTDGFTGNAVLKSIEGTAMNMMSLLKTAILSEGVKGKMGALLSKECVAWHERTKWTTQNMGERFYLA